MAANQNKQKKSALDKFKLHFEYLPSEGERGKKHMVSKYAKFEKKRLLKKPNILSRFLSVWLEVMFA